MISAGGWFAPEVIARTALRHWAANWLLSGLPLRGEVGSASLSWLKPVMARDVRVWDEHGQEVLAMSELRTDRTLWQLVTDRSSLGAITLSDATANVRLRDDGSNVEDLIAVWNRLPSSEPVPSLRVELWNARIEFDHADAKRTSSLESFDVTFASSAAGLELFAMETPSKAAPDRVADAGRFAVYFGKPVAVDDNAHRPLRDAEVTSLQLHANSVGAHADAVAVKQPTARSDSARQLLLRAKDWRLDWLAPVASRWQRSAEIGGTLTADLRVDNEESLRVDNEQSNAGASGNAALAAPLQTRLSLRVQDLLVAGLSGMKSDRLELTELRVRGQAAVVDDRMLLEEFELAAEPGSITVTGEFSLSGWSKGLVEDTLRRLGQQKFRAQADFDLAKIAALLPQTLAVREGTRIDGGSIRLAMFSQPQGGRENIQGKLEVARLTGFADGRRVDWEVPLQASIAAHRDGEQFVFDQVSCRADFLQADAKGTLTDATFIARADLDRLHQQLQRFFDWGIVRLSGQVAVNGEIQRRSESDHPPEGARPGSEPEARALRRMKSVGDVLELRTKAELTNVELQRRGESPWREQRLEMVASSSGRLTEQAQLRSIESAVVRLVSGEDRLDLTLLEPFDRDAPNARWRVAADVVGRLESWQSRLRPLLTVEGWQVAGQLAAHAEVSADPRSLDVSSLSVGVDHLQARGPEWLIQEPKLTFETAGRWESATSRWVAPHTVLVGTSAAATIDNLIWSLAPTNSGASGDAQFRVHLGNVSRWKVAAQRQPNNFVAGEATGSLRLQQRGMTTRASLDARVEQLTLGTPTNRTPSGWETLWQEPEITLATQAEFDSSSRGLKLSETKLIADGLEIDFTGSLDGLSSPPSVDVAGEVAYNWNRLTQRFGESLRQNVQLTGLERRKFAWRGRLSSPEVTSHAPPARSTSGRLSNVSRTTSPSDSSLAAWTGEAGLGWQSVNLYGLMAGPGDLSCKLTDGVGVLSLRELPVNEGTVRLNSQLRLDQSPPTIVLPSNRVIDKVRLSPELCAGWLKFIAPALAEATRADGRFSVVLENGIVPVLNPSASEVTGELTVHSAQVSPGPLAHQVMATVDRVKALTKIRSFKPADLLALVEPNAAETSPVRDRVWMTLPEQQVRFRMVEGRVHHDRLTMVTKEVTLISRGSVGLDESLDLVIEIPIRDDWIENRRELASLRGKSLKVPVRGSLTRPWLDPRALESLAQESLSLPVDNLIEKELQKGLQKLRLPSPKK